MELPLRVDLPEGEILSDRFQASLDREPSLQGKGPPWVRTAAAAYLILQGSGGLVWWGMLVGWPASRSSFLAVDAPDVTLLAFISADLLLFTLGGSLSLISGAVMAIKGRGTPLPIDCPRVMVVAGPYRYVRNPMAIAGLSQGVAVGIFLGSPAVVLYALCGGPIWNYLVRPAEEQDLAERFGESFLAYQAAVHCWWPRLRPYCQWPKKTAPSHQVESRP